MNSDSSSPRCSADGTTPTSSTIVKFDQRTGSATETIVTAVADLADTSPTALDPLYRVVDPECLDGIVRSVATRPSASGAEVTFRYHGYTITVYSYGVVEIAPRDAD